MLELKYILQNDIKKEHRICASYATSAIQCTSPLSHHLRDLLRLLMFKTAQCHLTPMPLFDKSTNCDKSSSQVSCNAERRHNNRGQKHGDHVMAQVQLSWKNDTEMSREGVLLRNYSQIPSHEDRFSSQVLQFIRLSHPTLRVWAHHVDLWSDITRFWCGGTLCTNPSLGMHTACQATTCRKFPSIHLVRVRRVEIHVQYISNLCIWQSSRGLSPYPQPCHTRNGAFYDKGWTENRAQLERASCQAVESFLTFTRCWSSVLKYKHSQDPAA